MSRIGQRPIKIEEGVSVEATMSKVVISAGENKLEEKVPAVLAVTVADGMVRVTRKNQEKGTRSLHGLYARLIKNMITGVKDNFTKILEFSGTGYRVAIVGDELVLNMGYSHEVKIEIPKELKVSVIKNTIVITGTSKELVGNFAAKTRDVRGPEVYKGKGIKYKGEFIKRKAGKTAASK